MLDGCVTHFVIFFCGAMHDLMYVCVRQHDFRGLFDRMSFCLNFGSPFVHQHVDSFFFCYLFFIGILGIVHTLLCLLAKINMPLLYHIFKLLQMFGNQKENHLLQNCTQIAITDAFSNRRWFDSLLQCST